MRYRIGDVARILGISTDLLRYYEKKGVVAPSKDKNNDYRYYDAWDINFLMDCLWFKNFGFSIEQIADMVRAPSTEDIADMFEYKEAELRSTIKRCTLLLERSERHRREMANIQDRLYKFDITDSPDLVRYLNRVNEEYPLSGELEPIARRWLAAMPFNHRYFEMSGSDHYWGFSLAMDYVEKLDFDISPPVKHMPPRKSVHTVFRSRGKGCFTPNHLDYAFDWMRENGYTPAGPARGILLASVLEDNVLGGYFDTWIPIE